MNKNRWFAYFNSTDYWDLKSEAEFNEMCSAFSKYRTKLNSSYKWFDTLDEAKSYLITALRGEISAATNLIHEIENKKEKLNEKNNA